MRHLAFACSAGVCLMGCSPVHVSQAGVHASVVAPSACTPGTWSTPRPLADSLGRLVYVEAPSAVRINEGIALFGTPTLLWRSATIFADTVGMIELAKQGKHVDVDTLIGAIVRGDGTVRTIGKPREVTRMQHPLAVAGPNGSADVFWMTAQDTTMRQFTDLWFARYRPSRWSVPEHVLHGHLLNWDTNSASAVAEDTSAVIAITGDWQSESITNTGI